MTPNETLTMTVLMLAPALFSLIGMAAFGSPVVALLGELAAKSKSKVFYDKYGQQTASMGAILLILLLIVEAAGIGVIYARYPHYVEMFMTQKAAFIPVLAAAGAFLVFGLPYLLLWKKMRNAKGAHMALGTLASASAVAMIAMAVPAKLGVNISGGTVNPYIQSLALPVAAVYTVFIMVAAAGLSCAWLVMRRNKDDFGRDYYNFSLKLAARWAFIPMIAVLAFQGWLFASLPDTVCTLVTGTPLGLVWAAGAALSLVCAVIWLLIARSESPLRLKGLTFLAATLLWLSHTANVVLFVNFMSM